MSKYTWWGLARCRGKDPTIFLGETANDRVIAEMICKRCPVKASCLNYAIENNEHGIWGGTNDKDRKWMRVFIQVAKDKAMEAVG